MNESKEYKSYIDSKGSKDNLRYRNILLIAPPPPLLFTGIRSDTFSLFHPYSLIIMN